MWTPTGTQHRHHDCTFSRSIVEIRRIVVGPGKKIQFKDKVTTGGPQYRYIGIPTMTIRS